MTENDENTLNETKMELSNIKTNENEISNPTSSDVSHGPLHYTHHPQRAFMKIKM
jgi:hypothetical protein